jgi:hypothetical protein
MKSAIWGISISLAGLAFAMPASADDVTVEVPATQTLAPKHEWSGKRHDAMKEVFEACAKSAGVAEPEPGSRPNWSAGDKSAMHSCMRQFHDDMKSCLAEAGVAPSAQGQNRKPSSVDQSTLKACQKKALMLISSK